MRIRNEPLELAGRTVLLIDDDEDALSVLSARCRSVGMHVETARNLLTALARIDRRRPDVICVDVELPTGNGLEFCDLLAADLEITHIPRIIITGCSNDDVLRRGRGNNAAVISKGPAVWGHLHATFQEIFANSPPPVANDAHATRRPTAESPRVVTAIQDATLRDTVAASLKNIDCEIICADSAADALLAVDRARPDLICLDASPSHDGDASLCAVLAADARFSEIPTLVITDGHDAQTLRECRNLTAYLISKSADVGQVIAQATAELLSPPPSADDAPSAGGNWMDDLFTAFDDNADRPGQGTDQQSDGPPWVLTIDDDPDFSDALQCRLEAHGVAVIRARDGVEGYRLAMSHPCSAILLDYQMPNCQGDYVLRRLKESPATADIPVIMLTGIRDRSIERKIRGMGAAAYFEKPVRFDILRDELADHLPILPHAAETPMSV